MAKQDNNIWTAASEGDIVFVKQAVEADKTKVDAKDKNGYTPLHAAASWGHTDLLRFLLDSGADVNITDSDGDTPLHMCEDKACAELLVARGADMEKRNHEGLTPVYTTLENEATAVTELLCSRLGIPVPTLDDGEETEQPSEMERAGDSADQVAESKKLEDLSNWIMQQVDDKSGADEEALKSMVTTYIMKNLRISGGEGKDDTVAATVASSTDRKSQDNDATPTNP
ncbi:hypothetical protein GGF46_000438 [Coemansia sp. RSA 552]|nr:hypothetical protein GGF46_000438 [Coemansia sp. RSA 552]